VQQFLSNHFKTKGMTKLIYQSMFYSLGALLMALIFVVQPTTSPEVNKFQSDLKNQFAVASQQLLAGPSAVEPLVLVWSGVSAFYDESSVQALALMQDDALINLALNFNSDYQLSLAMAQNPIPFRLATEDPIMNIVPDGLVASEYYQVNYPGLAALAYDDPDFILDPEFDENRAYKQFGSHKFSNNGNIETIEVPTQGRVAGESTVSPEWVAASVNPVPTWMTIHDSITNYPYCVSVFNGTVNSYPGVCAKDDYGQVYEN
jgi:hypothetical protein